MKKFWTIVFFASLLIFNTNSAVFSDETGSQPPQEQAQEEEELMFAPIDLDLSQEREEAVKKFKIRVESDSKP